MRKSLPSRNEGLRLRLWPHCKGNPPILNRTFLPSTIRKKEAAFLKEPVPNRPTLGAESSTDHPCATFSVPEFQGSSLDPGSELIACLFPCPCFSTLFHLLCLFLPLLSFFMSISSPLEPAGSWISPFSVLFRCMHVGLCRSSLSLDSFFVLGAMMGVGPVLVFNMNAGSIWLPQDARLALVGF